MIKLMINEEDTQEEDFSSFFSENGICFVEWAKVGGKGYEVWYCVVHDAEYYKDCVIKYADYGPK